MRTIAIKQEYTVVLADDEIQIISEALRIYIEKEKEKLDGGIHHHTNALFQSLLKLAIRE